MVSKLVGMLQQLNPSAQVIPCSRCGVDLQEVLLTGRFDMQKVCGTVAQWYKVLCEKCCCCCTELLQPLPLHQPCICC